MSSYDEKSRKADNIDRGNKGTDYAGTAIFFGGRLLDPFVQYGFLKNDWGKPFIERLRGKTLPQGPPLITKSPLDRLGLSPYRTILWAMSVGSMLKQTYHLTVVMQEKMSPAGGVMVSVFNMLGNTINSLLFVCAQTSASTNGEHFPQTPLIVGSALYTAGLVIEWLSEQQRYAFKEDPANKGKVYTGGLFGLSRHINYLGYSLWRTGYGLAAGGWFWAGTLFALTTLQFTQTIIPVHQHYMEERYGEQFEEYKKATPYKYIPWIY
ncbi:hypothetical protein PRZ48_007060 [Zasmidium cellare]|uniref:Steroid 5-alpha reductase C-terminal domain-containing protein n=1 Tax=Zasmidium cellare TaxID=395010 RepID=A0ABR0EJF0_ZASCE|nr:hypothetical protein PRZ48_007060 [Zasmidium cellare]